MDPRPYTYQFRKPRFSNPTFQSGHLYESIYHMGLHARMHPSIQKIQNQPTYQVPNNKANSQRQRQYDELVHQRMRRNDPHKEDLKRKFDNIRNNANNYTDQQPKENYNANRDQNAPDNYNNQRKNDVNQNYNQRKQQPQHYNNNNEQRSNSDRQQRSNQPRSYSQDVSTQNKSAYMSNYGDRLMRPLPGRDQDRVYEHQQKHYNIINCYPNQPATHRLFPKLTLENKLIETGQYYGQARNSYNPQKY